MGQESQAASRLTLCSSCHFMPRLLKTLDFADDDVDVWGLHANAKIGTFTVGAYGLNFRMNTYPFFVVNTGSVIFPGTSLQQFGQSPGTFKSHMYWLGAYLDGKAGPVNMNFDFVADYGSVDERDTRDLGEVAQAADRSFPPSPTSNMRAGWSGENLTFHGRSSTLEWLACMLQVLTPEGLQRAASREPRQPRVLVFSL